MRLHGILSEFSTLSVTDNTSQTIFNFPWESSGPSHQAHRTIVSSSSPALRKQTQWTKASDLNLQRTRYIMLWWNKTWTFPQVTMVSRHNKKHADMIVHRRSENTITMGIIYRHSHSTENHSICSSKSSSNSLPRPVPRSFPPSLCLPDSVCIPASASAADSQGNLYRNRVGIENTHWHRKVCPDPGVERNWRLYQITALDYEAKNERAGGKTSIKRVVSRAVERAQVVQTIRSMGVAGSCGYRGYSCKDTHWRSTVRRRMRRRR